MVDRCAVSYLRKSRIIIVRRNTKQHINKLNILSLKFYGFKCPTLQTWLSKTSSNSAKLKQEQLELFSRESVSDLQLISIGYLYWGFRMLLNFGSDALNWYFSGSSRYVCLHGESCKTSMKTVLIGWKCYCPLCNVKPQVFTREYQRKWRLTNIPRWARKASFCVI